MSRPSWISSLYTLMALGISLVVSARGNYDASGESGAANMDVGTIVIVASAVTVFLAVFGVATYCITHSKLRKTEERLKLLEEDLGETTYPQSVLTKYHDRLKRWKTKMSCTQAEWD